MPLVFPNLAYRSGPSYAVARPVTLPIFEAPFRDQGVNINYILRQTFQIDINSYAPLALDTAHPDYADFILVSEGPQQDMGGGVVQWERVYAKVPETFARPNGNYAYNFIGFFGAVGGVTVTGRDRFTRNVPVQLTREFYNTTDPDSIPVVQAQRYYYGSNPTLDLDALADSPPFTQATTPTRTEYEAMIAANEYNIVVEESQISVWQGNIYVRETRRIKAQ